MSVLRAAAVAAALLAALPAAAQEWPAHQVTIVVPFAAGSTPDLIGRVVADALGQKHKGAVFIVDNKPGASGNIGTNAVAKAKPDGYTIGVSIGGPLAMNTLLFSNLPYDPAKDIAAITQLVSQPSILAVNTNALKVNSAQELLAALKADPTKYTYGWIGNGSLSHLAMEGIALKAGAHPVPVVYASSGEAVTALLRGDVQLAVLPAIAITPQLKSGTIKALAVSTGKRSSFLPDIPTLKEAGIDVEADAWNGLIAPAGTPEAIIKELNAEVSEALKQPAVKEKLATQLMEPVGNSPEAFRAVIDAEVSRWAPVIKSANIKLD